jgi:hypothetical protein
VRVSIQAAIRSTCILVLALAAACASPHSDKKKRALALASEFYGVWVNTGPTPRNWWEISATDVIVYGFDNTGKCASVHAVVLDPELPEIQLGTTDTGTLHRQGDLLMFVTEGAGQMGLHQRSEAAGICRRADGTYAEGAPHAAAAQ